MDNPTKERYQQAFDRVWAGLRAQGFERSLNVDRSQCAYRGEDGKRCALGHLIPDDHYENGMELHNAAGPGILEAAGLRPRFGSGGDLAFALDLQVAHDDGVTPEYMENNLRRVAARYGLVVPFDIPESLR